MISGKKVLVLLILKHMSVLLFSSNTESFVQDKSSSTWQIIKVKSSGLQKLIRFLSGIATSTFNVDTGSCAGRSVSP